MDTTYLKQSCLWSRKCPDHLRFFLLLSIFASLCPHIWANFNAFLPQRGQMWNWLTVPMQRSSPGLLCVSAPIGACSKEFSEKTKCGVFLLANTQPPWALGTFINLPPMFWITHPLPEVKVPVCKCQMQLGDFVQASPWRKNYQLMVNKLEAEELYSWKQNSVLHKPRKRRSFAGCRSIHSCYFPFN